MATFTRLIIIALIGMIGFNLFLIHLLMSGSSFNQTSSNLHALTQTLAIEPQTLASKPQTLASKPQRPAYKFTDPALANEVMSKLDIFKLESFKDDKTMNIRLSLKDFYNLDTNGSYCEKHREYFANNSEYIFKQKNFMSSYAQNTQVRRLTLDKHYDNSMPHIPYAFSTKLIRMNPNISLIATDKPLFSRRQVMKHYSCLGQMSNHIPGHGDLTRKDHTVQALNIYAQTYHTRPQCFDYERFFPKSYMMFKEDQCKEFFNIFNSDAYMQEKKEKGVVYMKKIGAKVHVGEGVFPVDQQEEDIIRETYKNGSSCGLVKDNYIMQRFIHNTMLIDGYKFDFRVFMLVASSNPLIAYYHDGFLRVSDLEYDTFTVQKTSLVTNISPASRWTFEKFQDYLLQIGKITDTNWLDNYLRPGFKKAMVHVIRMSQGKFLKISSVFELYGTDFMIDEDLNLWYIEANPGPRIMFDTPELTELVTRMLRDEFDLVFSLLRSRMKRVINYVEDLITNGEAVRLEDGEVHVSDLSEKIKEFNEIIKNRMDPEFEIGPENTFSKIVDENYSGVDAYLGLIPEECL